MPVVVAPPPQAHPPPVAAPPVAAPAGKKKRPSAGPSAAHPPAKQGKQAPVVQAPPVATWQPPVPQVYVPPPAPAVPTVPLDDLLPPIDMMGVSATPCLNVLRWMGGLEARMTGQDTHVESSMPSSRTVSHCCGTVMLGERLIDQTLADVTSLGWYTGGVD